MTQYIFRFRADLRVREYYDSPARWLGLNKQIEVRASTKEEALRKAQSLLIPPERTDTKGWELFIESVEEIPEPPRPEPEPAPEPQFHRHKFRLKGAR